MTQASVLVPMQGCKACARLWHTPLPSCPFCASTDCGPVEVGGRGRVYAWTTVARSLESPPRPAPYTIVTVDLEAGGRVFGRYEGAAEPQPDEPVVCTRVDRDAQGALSFSPAL